MIGNSNRSPRFGVPFKHNTGRAICYFYTDKAPPVDNHESQIPILENLSVAKLESFKTISNHTYYSDVRPNLPTHNVWELSGPFRFGEYTCDVLIRIQNISKEL